MWFQRIKGKSVVSEAMREMAEVGHTELKISPIEIFRLGKGLKTDSKEVEGGRCMRGSD